MPEKKQSSDRQKYIERRTEYYKIKRETPENARRKAEQDANKIKWKSMVRVGLMLAVTVLALSGCAGLDSLVGYDHVTGVVSPESPIGDVEGVVGVFGPYGQVAAIGLGAVAAAYIAFRKIQKKLGK